MAGCFTLFATHFGRLSELVSMYPNARVWHLAVSTGAAGERLNYTRQLQPGAANNQHYGLLLATAVGIPAEVCYHQQAASVTAHRPSMTAQMHAYLCELCHS